MDRMGDQSTATDTPVGWDPHEVWRTRVLSSRLGEADAHRRMISVPSQGLQPRGTNSNASAASPRIKQAAWVVVATAVTIAIFVVTL